MKTFINYNGNRLSRTHVKNNILRVWNATTESDRHDWYTEANDYAQSLANDSSVTLPQACGIIAALSPLTSWEKNREYAHAVIVLGVSPYDIPTLKLSRVKAFRILNAETIDEITSILNGLKTTAFFKNILFPTSDATITIDRHAIAIALNKRQPNNDVNLTPLQYQFLADCYRFTAQSIGVSPILLQSATWVAWRNMK